MPPKKTSSTNVRPTTTEPIICPHCGGQAYLMRRTLHPKVKGEIWTFECKIAVNRPKRACCIRVELIAHSHNMNDQCGGRCPDLPKVLSHVRFTPESGHVQCDTPCLLWANSGHRACNALHNKEAANRGGLAWRAAQ